jgi:hypothetical protein
VIEKHGFRGSTISKWSVSPSRDFGEPGPLAYDFDTLFLNRMIDLMRPDIQRIFKIGDSLSDVNRALGRSGTRNTEQLKRAILQNVGVTIQADIHYKGKDGVERDFGFAASRYSVVFVGERLPGGKKAGAIHIILNEIFLEYLRNAQTRPLDYNYLCDLPPAPRRFYELISPEIYGAIIKNQKNQKASSLYSELCMFAPLARSFDWEVVRKQMARIHKPHSESGYISKVSFEKTEDKDGNPDWHIFYTPGRKAFREFREFAPKKAAAQLFAVSMPIDLVLQEGLFAEGQEDGTYDDAPIQQGAADKADRTIVERLMGYGIDETRAAQLIEKDSAEARLWADAWPHQNQKGMENPPAVLASFIEKCRRPLPAGYKKALEMEAKRKEQEEREERQRAYDFYSQYFTPQYLLKLENEYLAIEKAQPEPYKAFQHWLKKNHDRGIQILNSEELRRKITLRRAIEFFNEIRPELDIRLSTFEEWDESENAERQDPLEWFRSNQNIIHDLLSN